MIDKNLDTLSIKEQCELVGVSRSSFYYTPKSCSEYDLDIMAKIDEQYLKTPYYGSRMMTEFLKRQGFCINRKKVIRLMRKMGISAIYQKPKTSKKNPYHKIYPYLLKNIEIKHSNQVWVSDITYIPMKRGFIYLVAIMDLYSRYIVGWELSILQDTDSLISSVEKALRYGKPEIFNSDQGSQYTSFEFTSRLQEENIRISMDGKGRFTDNIFIERLWRSLKYEEVYLKAYETVNEARKSIGQYIWHYNNERLHSSLGYNTPAEIYSKNLSNKNEVFTLLWM